MGAQHSRRTYVASVGSTITAALAGCTGTDSDADGDDEPTTDEEDDAETPAETVEAFLNAIATADLATYNELVYDTAEADSMNDMLHSFGTFIHYFEDEIDDITIDEIAIGETKAVDVETMVHDVRDGDGAELEEDVQQGEEYVRGVEDEYGFADSEIIYTSYSANGEEITDYLLVVTPQSEWVVFDSLAY